MKIDALGEERRIGAGVAQLATQIEALTASKPLGRQSGRGIVEILSLIGEGAV